MCKELEAELKRGQKAMETLAEHLVAMGAGELEQNVNLDDVVVKITAKVVVRFDKSLDQ